MGIDSVMVVHGGGVYGDKEKTKQRWCDNYNNMYDAVKYRLVLENCERCFSIEDCLEVSKKINIPVVFDTHHFECYKILHPEEKFQEPEHYIPLILETWKRKGVKPKFHVSEQGSGRTGHHSDFIEVIPQYLLEILNHIKEEEIQLQLKNDVTPALISSSDSNNIYVILPIRV